MSDIRLEEQIEKEAQLAVEWDKKARIAVRAGDDDLAKEALRKKVEHELLALRYMQQAGAQSTAAGADLDERRDDLSRTDFDLALVALKAEMSSSKAEERGSSRKREQPWFHDDERGGIFGLLPSSKSYKH